MSNVIVVIETGAMAGRRTIEDAANLLGGKEEILEAAQGYHSDVVFLEVDGDVVFGKEEMKEALSL